MAASVNALAYQLQVRALSPTGDPLYGNGLGNFLTGIQAISQLIKQTLLLFTNEWWEAVNAGTPVFTQLLGHPITDQAVAMILQDRILSLTPWVTGINAIYVTYAAGTRALTFNASVSTIFGTVQVGNS